MTTRSLLEVRECGLYCAPGDFYIDPWRGVERAVITHGHSDHARWGSRSYLCHPLTAPVLKHRLGSQISVQTVPYGEVIMHGGVAISLHPAGHIPGSAQVAVEYAGERWVVSGDYKLQPDGISDPFVPVRCATFITECTFGLPIFHFRSSKEIFDEIHAWWEKNRGDQRPSLLLGYSLGKAQRLLANLDPGFGPIYAHGAIINLSTVLRDAGLPLPPLLHLERDTPKSALSTSLILAPPGAEGTPWAKKLGNYSAGYASGWMSLRGAKRRANVDRGFALSDHADWDELQRAIRGTGASRILCTHGYTAIFSRWLREQGYEADVLPTRFEGESTSEISSEEA